MQVCKNVVFSQTNANKFCRVLKQTRLTIRCQSQYFDYNFQSPTCGLENSLTVVSSAAILFYPSSCMYLIEVKKDICLNRNRLAIPRMSCGCLVLHAVNPHSFEFSTCIGFLRLNFWRHQWPTYLDSQRGLLYNRVPCYVGDTWLNLQILQEADDQYQEIFNGKFDTRDNFLRQTL